MKIKDTPPAKEKKTNLGETGRAKKTKTLSVFMVKKKKKKTIQGGGGKKKRSLFRVSGGGQEHE